jgi:hypothetical protein
VATGAERPVCVLLLPRPAAAYAPGAALLRAPGAVAVEPPPLSYAAQGRVPGALADRIAAAQARRLALPGEPRAVVAFEALQYPLARALLALHDGAELWYGGAEAAAGRRRALHAAAAARAALTFVPGEDSRPLLARMEALGIESGRLGSER